MKRPLIDSLVMGVLMMFSCILTIYMTPVKNDEIQLSKLNLDKIVPSNFGEWKVDTSITPFMVSPDVEGEIGKIYNQTLSRTYIDRQGERVMLSIAYGADQRTDLNIHRPEVCYLASGFEVGKLAKTFVQTTLGNIPAMHLVARQGVRNEPITYWIRMGDKLTRGWFEQKLASIGYGLTGSVPDGLLFRVSTISNDERGSFQLQQKFVSDLLLAISSTDQHWIIGKMPL